MPVAGTDVSVDGHAIVSVDGMIADAKGSMPPELRSDADWRLFQAALDGAALIILGRLGHERHRNPGRPRLVLTRSIQGLVHDPNDQLAHLWNPEQLGIAEVLTELGISRGTLAVTGGTSTFDLFLPHYDRFVLSEVRNLELPAGTPCFSRGHPRLVLPGAGLEARDMAVIDSGVVQTNWVRPAPRH